VRPLRPLRRKCPSGSSGSFADPYPPQFQKHRNTTKRIYRTPHPQTRIHKKPRHLAGVSLSAHCGRAHLLLHVRIPHAFVVLPRKHPLVAPVAPIAHRSAMNPRSTVSGATSSASHSAKNSGGNSRVIVVLISLPPGQNTLPPPYRNGLPSERPQPPNEKPRHLAGVVGALIRQLASILPEGRTHQIMSSEKPRWHPLPQGLARDRPTHHG